MRHLRQCCDPLTIALIVLLGWSCAAPYVVHNVSTSLAPGWYWCWPDHSTQPLAPGTIVALVIPASLQAVVLAKFPQSQANLPWLKRTLGRPGDMFCVDGTTATLQTPEQVPGVPRLLPPSILPAQHAGCWILDADGLVVLGDHPASVDSKFFGPLTRTSVYATCAPLITWGTTP
jgi:type IV secretory pathway protease TraF